MSAAHNSVVHTYSKSEPFAYAHNIILGLAIGVGIPATLLLAGAAFVWLWRRVNAANDLVTWYCIAVALPFGVHSMFEFPLAYAYFLVPVMFLVGVLEGHLAPGWTVRMPWWTAATFWLLTGAVMVWSVAEYIAIEEDFRVLRFEALKIGRTPSDYQPPSIVLLTQLDAFSRAGALFPSLV